MPSSALIHLSPYYLSEIKTIGSFTVYTVNAANKHIGSSTNSYICGNGNSYDILYPPSEYTINLGLTIN